MSHLLSRYAESAYWLGRYVERAESLARVIDVNDTFSRSSRGIADWAAVLRLYADEARYRQAHGEPTARGVVHFYLYDRENLGSVVSSLAFARDNARTLRPMISTEIWDQLNTFYNDLKHLDVSVCESPGLYRVCNQIKHRCQMHAGAVEATMYRDEAWYFYHFGKSLERGAQTSHYLDVRYRDLRLNSEGEQDFDPLPWTALLRSQSALHGFRRVSRRGITPRRVAAFLLFDHHFPRSVWSSVHALSTTFDELVDRFGLPDEVELSATLGRLGDELGAQTIEGVLERDLHVYLDQVQQELYAVSDRMHDGYFGR